MKFARKSLFCFVLLNLMAVSLAHSADDVQPPDARITYPADGSVLTTNWAAIRGTATDEPGGSGLAYVTLAILSPDGRFWDGTNYVDSATPISLSTIITDGTNWARTSGIPVKNDLQWGTYLIFADAYDLAGNNIGVSIAVTMNVPPAPANDDFANAQLINGALGELQANTLGATREPGEPLHAFVQGSASVWYKWVAPEAGFLTVRTLGSTIDTIMAVYTGSSVSNLTLQDGDDDGGQLGSSTVQTSVAQDVTYYIAIDGKFNASGPIKLSWEFSSLARPRLKYRLTNSPSASIVISWPAAATGFSLYSNSQAEPLNGWVVVAGQPIVQGGEQFVTVPIAADGRVFFRLQKP